MVLRLKKFLEDSGSQRERTDWKLLGLESSYIEAVGLSMHLPLTSLLGWELFGMALSYDDLCRWMP